MTAAPQDPLEMRGSRARSLHLPRTGTWCRVADLLVERPLDVRHGAGLSQPNELQGDGPARIVDGAVLVRATTPTHMTANASTLMAITAGPRE